MFIYQYGYIMKVLIEMTDRRKIGQATIKIPEPLRVYRYQRLYLLYGEDKANRIWRSYYSEGILDNKLVESRDYEHDIVNKLVVTIRL